MIRPKAIVSSAVRVTIFWTLLFAVLYWEHFNKINTIFNLLVIGISIVFALLLTSAIIVMDRRSIEISLESKTIRGMFCTLGAIPVHSPALTMSNHFPPKSVYPEEAENSDFLDAWRKTMPAPMQGLLDVVLKTLWEHKTTPAAPLMRNDGGTWVSNGSHNHGGRSLVTHSLMVSYLMCEQAKDYQYKVPMYNNIQLYKPLDLNYKLDPKDPLIPIIGLAHDLGKIECMVWEDGKPNKMKEGHDYKGACIVARMDAFWHSGIDSETRRILQTILAHYHHVQDIPMEKDGKPTSDRLHALMELLVKADKLASVIENCTDSSKIEILKKQPMKSMDCPNQMVDLVVPETIDLISAIHAVLLGFERINVGHAKSLTSIGWKYFLPQFGKTVLLLKEDDFISAVAGVMGIEISPVRPSGVTNPVSHLTQNVLKVLNVADLLFSDFDDCVRSPVSQLYRADFYNPSDYFSDIKHTIPKDEDALAGVKRVFGLESTIALQIDDYPILQKIKDMPDYQNIFRIGRAKFGNQGVHSVGKKIVVPQSIIDPIKFHENIKMAVAEKAAEIMSPARFEILIAKEIAKPENERKFKLKAIPAEGKEPAHLLLHDMDNWFTTLRNMVTFEEIQKQSKEWLLAAKITEVKITEKGNKLIRYAPNNNDVKH